MPLGHFFHDWSLKVNFLEEIRSKIEEKADKREKKTQKHIISSITLIRANEQQEAEQQTAK